MKKFLGALLWPFRSIKVFALVGKSGTGKSFRARLVMEKHNIEMMIDDGLLIKGDKILAGKSAKRENAYLSAVKTALFTEKSHRKEVKAALERQHFKRILIIGTSERMVRKIAKTLGLPEPSPKRMIQIEDIATTEEIDTAINHRRLQGRHVIPVPTIEVKRTYPQVMTDSVKLFFRRGLNVFKKPNVFEKTVVRPEFSKKGSVSISESALSQMIMHCIDEYSPGLRIGRVTVKHDHRGYRFDVYVNVPYNLQLSGSIHGLQQYIIDHIERFTGVIIDELNIIIDNVVESTYT
jgi:uncharacterized alkaline shock family protein YloU